MSSQLASRPVRWPGGQPGSCQLEASQSRPRKILDFFFTPAYVIFVKLSPKIARPRKKKVRKKPCVGADQPACQPQQPAGKSPGSPGSSWQVSQRVNCTTDHARRRTTGWPGSSCPLSCPGVFSILSLLESTRGRHVVLFLSLARNPGNNN